ncbi:hypothetical protein ONS96_005248 [Cadophora gregata f. sp. sojae]|nr:hypothetical protein ONS96_005248 [Cadophora gregata f. sp. sojae]
MGSDYETTRPPDQKLEIHYIAPTQYVPNSKLPILIYRSVIPDPDDHDGTAAILKGNGYRVDGFYGCYDTPHYHSNTVEAYAFVRGFTTIKLGKGPRDEDVGNEFYLSKGDLFVQPAGMVHSMIKSSPDCKYAGAYPEGSPHWDVRLGNEDPQLVKILKEDAAAVPIPASDPIFGPLGPLVRIWMAVNEGNDLLDRKKCHQKGYQVPCCGSPESPE